VQILSGDTGLPVPRAKVIAGGVETLTNEQGTAEIPSAAALHSHMDIEAAGFLHRQTVVERVLQYNLWPRENAAGITEAFTMQVLYTSAGVGTNDETPSQPLSRWRRDLTRIDVVYLGPGDNAGYRELSPAALQTLRRAVAELNRAAAGVIVYGEPRPGPTATLTGVVQVRLFPEDPTCVTFGSWALTQRSAIESAGATVTFCAREASEDLGAAVHELGHTLGFHHSRDAQDVMSAPPDVEAFSARERATMKLMFQRPPFNYFPDNDRSAVHPLARMVPPPIVCR
jgi:hypothetical protein